MAVAAMNVPRLWQQGLYMTERLYQYRRLLWHQIKQQLLEQHAGQMLGAAWPIVHPLFLMAVYTFIFSVVFVNRIGGTYNLPLDYTAYIMSGLIPWLAIQFALNTATTALTGNAGLIKQVVFPVEVLPVKTVLSTFLSLGITLMVLVVYVLATTGSLPWTYVLIPVLLVIHAVWIIGFGLLLAAVGAYFRDLRELTQMFSLAGMFLLPVIYLPTWVPALFRPILYINPFSYLIWCYQDVLYFGRIEHPWAWVVAVVFGALIYCTGARIFLALKHYFGEIL